jgi:hypothetical protein
MVPYCASSSTPHTPTISTLDHKHQQENWKEWKGRGTEEIDEETVKAVKLTVHPPFTDVICQVSGALPMAMEMTTNANVMYVLMPDTPLSCLSRVASILPCHIHTTYETIAPWTTIDDNHPLPSSFIQLPTLWDCHEHGNVPLLSYCCLTTSQ